MSDIIIALSLAVAFLTAVAALITVYRARYFKKGTDTSPAFCDLLDYAFIADNNVIVLKNGALLSIFAIEADDLSHAADDRVNECVRLLQSMVHRLDGSLCLHFDLLRDKDTDYKPLFKGSNDFARMLDARRHEKLLSDGVFKNSFYIGISKKGRGFDGNVLKGKKEVSLQRELESFRATLSTLTRTLEHFAKVRALGLIENESFTGHEAVDFIFKCIYDRNVHLSCAQSDFLDLTLSPFDVKVDDHIEIEGERVAVIAIEGLPYESFFAMADTLGSLPFALRLNLRYMAFDSVISALYLEKYRRMWSQKSKGFFAQLTDTHSYRENRHASDSIEEIDEAKAQLDKGLSCFGSMCLNLIIRDTDAKRLDDKKMLIFKTLDAIGFKGRAESVNAMEAFLGSLPGHMFENLRRPIVSSTVLCDLIPLYTEYTGESVSPNTLPGMLSPLCQAISDKKQAFYLNLHDKDLANTLVIGPPGSGKSVLLGHLILNLLRYEDISVVIFEKGYSFYALTKALGGSHLELKSKDAQLCPLYHLDSTEDMALARDYIEYLLRLTGMEFLKEYRDDIDTALNLTAQLPHYERTLTAFCSYLNKRQLLEAMQPYLSVSGFVSPLDGCDDLCLDNKVTTVELEGLFERSDISAGAILRHLFNLVERMRVKDKKPKAIVIDEAWLVLKDELFAKQLVSWLKTLRKDNIFVILATQSVDDLMSSSISRIFLDCIKTRIYLPNPALGESRYSIKAYEDMGLNDNDIKTIARAVNKKHYYFVKNSNKALIELNLTDSELKLLSVSGAAAVDEVDRCYAIFGNAFYEHLA